MLALGILFGAARPLLDGEPAKYIHVRWRPGVTEDERRWLERRFSLMEQQREGRSFGYDLLDDSRANIRALIEHPYVEDTHDLDRGTFTVGASAEFGDRRTGLVWRWGFERQLPWLTWSAGAFFVAGVSATVGARRLKYAAKYLRIAMREVMSRFCSAFRCLGTTVARIGRWWNFLVGVSRRVSQFYGLSPAVPPPGWPGRDRALLLTFAVAFQTVLLFALFLGYECDAANFYSFAKAISGWGGAFSSTRPPLFPAFLVLTGMVWPGTFVFVVLAQAAMGVAIPLLVYRILYKSGQWFALIGAFLLILSTTAFVGAKLILAEQLYAFLTILTVFFLARYQDRPDPRSIYWFVLAGLGAMLTRWEAAFVFVLGTCGMLLLAIRRPRHLRHAVLATGFALVVVGGYSVARAVALGDLRLIGTLQSGTGFQLFQRVYGFTRQSIESKLGLFATIFADADPGAEAQNSPLVNPANGPASRQLRDIVARAAREHPDSFRGLKGALESMYREADAPPDPYQELYGRFEGSPDALADHIFRAPNNFRTAQYPFYVSNVVQQNLGLRPGDRLQFAAALEGIRAYPGVALAMFADGFTLTGLSVQGMAAVARNPTTLQNWHSLYPVWGVPGYVHVDFNVGNCAAGSLPLRLMHEYRFDQRLTNTPFARATRAIVLAGTSRNVVRACCGTVLLLGWWLLFFSPRRAVIVPVLIALGCLILTVGIGVAGGNSKYDICFMPLLVITAVSIVAEAARRTVQPVQASAA